MWPREKSLKRYQTNTGNLLREEKGDWARYLQQYRIGRGRSLNHFSTEKEREERPRLKRGCLLTRLQKAAKNLYRNNCVNLN